MEPFVWDEWPDLFRGRLRVLYELTGEIPKQPRAPLPWYISGRRARLDYDVGLPVTSALDRRSPSAEVHAGTS